MNKIQKAVEAKENTNIQEKSVKQTDSVISLLKAKEATFSLSLPKTIDKEQFMQQMCNAVYRTPKLASCSQTSLLFAFLSVAQLGLTPNNEMGEAYIIPFKNEANLVLGYKGLLTLAYRNSKVSSARAEKVCEYDELDIDLGSNIYIKHKPLYAGNRGKAIGYYAIIDTVNGGKIIKYMTKEEVEEERKYSKTDHIWNNHFDAMAMKTVLKRALTFAPKDTEFDRAMSLSEGKEKPQHFEGEYMPTQYIDMEDEEC